ncbi:MAG: helix-turn-helix domain-containing protein [Bacillota bacterium]
MAGNKKEVILDAAIKVISDKGYYNTKMSLIADRAEIAVGAIQGVVERAIKLENLSLLDEAVDKIIYFIDCSNSKIN